MATIKGKIVWTPELKAEAVSMFLHDKSYSYLAQHFGVSLGTIAGICRRAGARISDSERSRRQSGTFPKIARAAKPEKLAEAFDAAVLAAPVSKLLPLALPITVFCQETSDSSVDIFGLGPTTCRWPLWPIEAPSGRYCGATCEVLPAYCPRHSLIAYAGLARVGMTNKTAQAAKAVANA